ncbi:MAG: Uma2 family endonuclease [Candidatus Symbiothrix sp.]|jgi:Uma2 family endonuclease|nr:Uma2 family endonuclease [Candidatus Symbiothrix sp.]
MEKKLKNYPTEEELDKNEEKHSVKEPAAVYISRSKRYTYADYLSWMDDARRELIDGVVYDLLSAPTRFHSRISGSIFGRLWNYVAKRKGKCEIHHAPFDVRFPKNGETADDKIATVVQPDICVVCDPSKLDGKGCIGAPDLIVEVQSPSTAKRDLNEKFNLYEEAGVKEYWVVFPAEKALTVFLLQKNGKFDVGTTYEYEGKVPVSIFKGLKIDMKELFED